MSSELILGFLCFLIKNCRECTIIKSYKKKTREKQTHIKNEWIKKLLIKQIHHQNWKTTAKSQCDVLADNSPG